jgi:hypothetical protein
MADVFGPHGPKPTPYRIIGVTSEEPVLSRIIEVSPEELEAMKLGTDGVDEPNPRDHIDHDSTGHHGHLHGPDFDVDHSGGHGGFHVHTHPQ